MTEEEVALLMAVTEDFVSELDSGTASRVQYESMLKGLKEKYIAENALSGLEVLLIAGLETGRICAKHGRDGEQLANSIYLRTPRGRRIEETLKQTNKALEQLEGQTIRKVHCTNEAFGLHRIRLDASKCSLVLDMDREGIRVASIEVEF